MPRTIKDIKKSMDQVVAPDSDQKQKSDEDEAENEIDLLGTGLTRSRIDSDQEDMPIRSLGLEELDILTLSLADQLDQRQLLAQVLSEIAQRMCCHRSVSTTDDEQSLELFQEAITLFESSQIRQGLEKLTEARKLNESASSEFYDKSVQQLIKQKVRELLLMPQLGPIQKIFLEKNESLTARCPARLDLHGGWSDTPPICYEQGGSVLNCAIKVNGEKPIGVRIRRLELPAEEGAEPLITIEELDSNYKLVNSVSLCSLADMRGYNEPFGAGNLVKAALICCQLVDVHSHQPLLEQLCTKIEAGLVVSTWSRLPQGSGLGTSSILASCIIGALWKVTGRQFNNSDLIHATLYVEQVITTGGGWQDQVGGVCGAVNLGMSLKSDQLLSVLVDPVQVRPEFLDRFFAHTVLIYTGTVRLAKNILTNVVRNWYLRSPYIIKCFSGLVAGAEHMRVAFETEKIELIGELLNEYWEAKKTLAPSCEPAPVRKFFTNCRHLILGGSMAGAGGGGFMVVILKDPKDRTQLEELARDDLKHSEIFQVELDRDGIEFETDK